MQKLCLQPGISTRESSSGIVTLLSDMCTEYGADTVEVDADGNVVAVIGTGSKTILIEAHMDEVGFVITGIQSDGNASLSPYGVVNGEKIAGSQAYMLRTGSEGQLVFDQEAGLSFQPSVQGVQSQSGDLISFKRHFEQVDDTINATALDNRIGCAVLLETLRAYGEANAQDVRLVFVFTLGEETDTTSVKTAVATYAPDLFIVVDAAYATPVDFDFTTPEENIPTLGEGCAIQYKGQGFVVDPNKIAALEKIAKEQNIRVQRESVNGNRGKTNLTEFVAAGTSAGVVINIPTQNQHREISTTDVRDGIEAVRLLLAITSNSGI